MDAKVVLHGFVLRRLGRLDKPRTNIEASRLLDRNPTGFGRMLLYNVASFMQFRLVLCWRALGRVCLGFGLRGRRFVCSSLERRTLLRRDRFPCFFKVAVGQSSCNASTRKSGSAGRYTSDCLSRRSVRVLGPSGFHIFHLGLSWLNVGGQLALAS